MEPNLTERDVAMLLLDEQALVNLGAVLVLQARMPQLMPELVGGQHTFVAEGGPTSLA
jgi:hypothetical protein